MNSQVVICSKCGKKTTIEGMGISQYFEDIMLELGWYKNKKGEWVCDEH